MYRLFLFLVFFAATTAAQDPLKPVLVDEFGPDVVCENLGSRVDLWLMETKFPESVGYAIVSGPLDQLLARINRRESIYGQLRWRFAGNPELTRPVVILEGPEAPSIKVELFRSKRNDVSLLSKGIKWDLDFPVTRPFAFYKSQEDGGICPSVNERKQFVDLIRANSTLRGNVVIYENSKKDFEKQRKSFLDRVEDVPLSRFSFFHSRKYYASGHYELWLVPSRRK